MDAKLSQASLWFSNSRRLPKHLPLWFSIQVWHVNLSRTRSPSSTIPEWQLAFSPSWNPPPQIYLECVIFLVCFFIIFETGSRVAQAGLGLALCPGWPWIPYPPASTLWVRWFQAYVVLRIKPRAPCTLDKLPTAEPHPSHILLPFPSTQLLSFPKGCLRQRTGPRFRPCFKFTWGCLLSTALRGSQC